MTDVAFAHRTAIAGIGATEFSKKSGRSELQLALEAIRAALEDAGLTPADVKGLVTFTADNTSETEIARYLGIPEMTYFARTPFGGGGACATVEFAGMAVASGVADVVVCYRAFNERSETRFGDGKRLSARPSIGDAVLWGWSTTFGLMSPAGYVAMTARRYMHAYGATSADFGRIAVADRKHAATNPSAWFYQKPITLEEHQASRWIVEPLRLLDCCQETDGGVAVVVTSLERAKDLRRPPAVIAAGSQGCSANPEQMTSYNRDDITGLPEMNLVARQLWSQSGLRPEDMQAAILYDHFTPLVLVQLEELGFCKRGEAPSFIANGAIELGGRLPINTHGGQLGEGYLHGMNGITEAVRQIRGDAVNQVRGCRNVLVTAGTGLPTSGLVLRAA